MDHQGVASQADDVNNLVALPIEQVKPGDIARTEQAAVGRCLVHVSAMQVCAPDLDTGEADQQLSEECMPRGKLMVAH